MLPDGSLILPENYGGKDRDFQVLLEREVFKQPSGVSGLPPHLRIMRQLELAGNENMSDHGHLRFYPKGALLMDLLADYLLDIVLDEGAYPVKNSPMYDASLKPIRQHAELFGDRLYFLKPEDRKFVLRYAACFGQFSILKDAAISHRNLPLKLFELADSYRLEQSGEVSGLFRQRRFHMGDMHVLCRDLESAKQELLRLYVKAHQIAKEFGWEYAVVINMCRSFYQKNSEFVLNLMRAWPKPVLLYLGVPEGKYYWVININLNFIDNLNRPVESAAMQIDLGNAERFNIKYVDSDGKQRYPPIVHAALMGSLERWINNLLENAAKKQKEGKLPSLPFWLSPMQARILPIADRHLSKAVEIAEKLKASNLRVDVDDRSASLPRKIREARKEWMPIYVVIGDREVENDLLSVSLRKDEGYVRQRMSAKSLIRYMRSRCRGKPLRKSYVSMLLSKRPKFA